MFQQDLTTIILPKTFDTPAVAPSPAVDPSPPPMGQSQGGGVGTPPDAPVAFPPPIAQSQGGPPATTASPPPAPVVASPPSPPSPPVVQLAAADEKMLVDDLALDKDTNDKAKKIAGVQYMTVLIVGIVGIALSFISCMFIAYFCMRGGRAEFKPKADAEEKAGSSGDNTVGLRGGSLRTFGSGPARMQWRAF